MSNALLILPMLGKVDPDSISPAHFILLSAWLNIVLFAGRLSIITASAGVASMIAGAMNVRNYFADSEQ